MRNQLLRHFALLAIVILTGFLAPATAFAQERIPIETPDVEEKRDKMAWKDYNQDVHSRYEKIMTQVDRMQKQMAEKKMDNEKFRKSLSKFETKATALHERMKNADNIAAENQEEYRKKVKSELQKLNKDYNKLMDKWEKMNA